jgi:hypothetical protein
MTVVDGELTSFNTTMIWVNGTAVHSHEFLNFETTDDVDISAEDQTIFVAVQWMLERTVLHHGKKYPLRFLLKQVG